MLPPVLLEIPFSTVFIFLLAATISLLTSLANRLLTNPEKSKAWRKEIAEWNTELRKAQRNGDKKRTEKLMKKQKQIMQLQSKMMWQSMKVMLLFIVPLFLIWQFLGGFYTSSEGTPISIAYFPGVGPIFPFLNMVSLFWWYLLSSFLFGTVFSHLFGLVSME
jgi:uncharacterized membrane protein (DUF106 family)